MALQLQPKNLMDDHDSSDDNTPLSISISRGTSPLPLQPAAPTMMQRTPSGNLYQGQNGNPSLLGPGAVDTGNNGGFSLGYDDEEDAGFGLASPRTRQGPPQGRQATLERMQQDDEGEGVTGIGAHNGGDDGVEDDGDIYIPGLSVPQLFTMLPMTDGLTQLIDKYFPPPERPLRDLTGEGWRRGQGEGVDRLIAKESWRSVASWCKSAILDTDPSQTRQILAYWSLRLHSLTRLSLPSHLSSELSSLVQLLPPAFHHPHQADLIPFEFYFYEAVLPSWLDQGAGGKEETVVRLTALVHECKRLFWRTSELKWKERAEAILKELGKGLVDIKAFTSVHSLFSPTASTTTPPTTSSLSLLAKTQLSTGDLSAFQSTLMSLQQLSAGGDQQSSKRAKVLEALGWGAQGEWAKAEGIWRDLLAGENEMGEKGVATNNLAVSLLFQGKLDEAKSLLLSLIPTVSTPSAPSATSTTSTPLSFPTLFNLSTIYELRTEHAAKEKLRLVRMVAGDEGMGMGGVGQGEALDWRALKLAV
ncbi:hypothetical protein T439DRAFT_383575 [Meredithblackwellia eburnea MCA 4105]